MKALPALLASLLIPIVTGTTLAQLPSNLSSGAASAAARIPGSIANLPAVPAVAGSPGLVAGTPETGLLGIGKPRTFPVLRYFGQRHAEKKAKLRSSPLGKLFKGFLKPISKLTGGTVPAEPAPNHVQLAAPGPQGSAAKIKLDQLQAPKRLAAIQQLGEVDCHWYPEALAQLVFALRSDRSECVRFEAAKILTDCGCCNPTMLNALRVCVAGTETDGNPGERSIRVRNQAAIALENCLACAGDIQTQTPSEPLRPEYPNEPESAPDIDPSSYYSAQDLRTRANTMDDSIGQVVFYQEKKPENVKTQAELIELSKTALESFRNSQPEAGKGSFRSLHDVWKKSK